jgi:hypothetical protein
MVREVPALHEVALIDRLWLLVHGRECSETGWSYGTETKTKQQNNKH